MIYENPYALPRAFIAYRPEYADTYKQAQRILSGPGFDPRYQVVLEEEAPQGYKSEAVINDNAKISIKEYHANKVVINAQTENPGVLILSDIYYPGWRAYVDGKESKIYRVNGLLRGVFIEKGQHEVIFKYMPASFIAGISLSLISVVICIGVVVMDRNYSYIEKSA
jgi:uncharacterized membrane protein YfhO